MSNLKVSDVNGLMEAYEAVYDPDLREALEEEREVQEVGLQIIENAAYVLFSQGYDVDDVISYFTEATTDVIVEDFVNFSEGTLILESVAVSDEYIAEQFEILYEKIGAVLPWLAKQAGRAKQAFGGIKQALTPATKAPVKNYKSPLTTTLSQGSRPPGVPSPSATTPGRLQKAGSWAQRQMMKIPGARTVGNIAKSPVGKFTGKVGGKVLPGVGLALGAMDATERAKKGDWGGAALSGLGAAASTFLPPGAGLAAALGIEGLKAATDAAGLTGDKSRKGAAPKSPTGDKSKWNASKALGGKAAFTAGGGKEKMKLNPGMSAADVQKQGMINIRNKKPAAAPASPAPAAATPAPSASGRRAPAATPPKPAASPKSNDSSTNLTPMQQWAKANPNLASKVKVGQSGYDEISATREKPGPNEKQDQTPTQGPKTTPQQDTDFAKQAAQATAEFQKKEQEKLKQQQRQPVNASYEYDAFDLVLEYLTSEGHVNTLDEALYVMMEMDPETIQSICEAAKDQSDKQIEKGVKTTYKAQNVIDNQHQGRSRGLNRLPAGERAAKSKRMGARLKARRDDLFQERGNREDEKREKLKKILGL